jgi:hypothetical protein
MAAVGVGHFTAILTLKATTEEASYMHLNLFVIFSLLFLLYFKWYSCLLNPHVTLLITVSFSLKPEIYPLNQVIFYRELIILDGRSDKDLLVK